jgi:hypothetical protein
VNENVVSVSFKPAHNAAQPNKMTLADKIERTFALRPMPNEAVALSEVRQLDSDVEEALWFSGRDWHGLTLRDWEEHPCAVFFFSADPFAYYLPSVLLLSIENPTEWLQAADALIGQLDRTPIVDGWDESFANRFLALRSEELDVVKEWLLQICEYVPYERWGIAASGPGDTFGRAYGTVDLLQKEVERRRVENEPRLPSQ